MHQSLTHKTHPKKRRLTQRSKFRVNFISVVRQAFARASCSPFVLALLVALAMMIVFTIRPDIDLEVSRQFWAEGFTLGEDEFLISVRDLNRRLPWVLLSGLVFMLVVMPFSRGLPRLFPPHRLLLIIVFCPGTGRCGACPEKPVRQGKAAASRRVRGRAGLYTGSFPRWQLHPKLLFSFR